MVGPKEYALAAERNLRAGIKLKGGGGRALARLALRYLEKALAPVTN